MAKQKRKTKRRGLGGTKAQHNKTSSAQQRHALDAAERVLAYSDGGPCNVAADMLAQAYRALGAAEQDAVWGTTTTAFTATQVGEALTKFKKKCLVR